MIFKVVKIPQQKMKKKINDILLKLTLTLWIKTRILSLIIHV